MAPGDSSVVSGPIREMSSTHNLHLHAHINILCNTERNRGYQMYLRLFLHLKRKKCLTIIRHALPVHQHLCQTEQTGGMAIAVMASVIIINDASIILTLFLASIFSTSFSFFFDWDRKSLHSKKFISLFRFLE
jgi:hypothetical protein